VLPVSFPFRPWVRRACVKAAAGGVVIVAAVAAAGAWLAEPGDFAWRRAVEVLAAYGALFLVSLAKIWWTARRPAVVLGAEALSWQPLHRFGPQAASFTSVLAVGQRAGTESLRLVVAEPGGAARELFLNLGLVDGRNELLAGLAERLRASGLEPAPGAHALRRPEFADPGLGLGG
jgi:hypothetical protein